MLFTVNRQLSIFFILVTFHYLSSCVRGFSYISLIAFDSGLANFHWDLVNTFTQVSCYRALLGISTLVFPARLFTAGSLVPLLCAAAALRVVCLFPLIKNKGHLSTCSSLPF